MVADELKACQVPGTTDCHVFTQALLQKACLIQLQPTNLTL